MTWSYTLIQKYFAAAENDKKRYIEELKAYQQTETYQALIKRQLAKKLKNIVGRYTNLKENESVHIRKSYLLMVLYNK